MAAEWLVPLVKSIRWFSVVSVRGQVDEPGCGGAEAAGIEVEPYEMLFEIHAQPLAPGRLGVTGSMADERRGDPLASDSRWRPWRRGGRRYHLRPMPS
jgi:hypothetical protein